jgi:hypothetical protein
VLGEAIAELHPGAPGHSHLSFHVRRGAKSCLRAYAVGTSRWRGLPDYLIIGAKRSGTTALARWLTRQAGVRPLFPPLQGIKGVHYFDRHFTQSEEWYRSFFPLIGGQRRVISGEASPYYLYHPFAARRAAQVVPGARLIVLLRQPVARALSHFRDERKLGNETRPLLQALEEEASLMAPEHARMEADPTYYSFTHEHLSYVEQGAYHLHLRRWLEAFPREQLFTLRSEDLFSDPAPHLARLLAFLGLPGPPRTPFVRENAAPPMACADPEALGWLGRRLGSVAEELSDLLGTPITW